MLIDLTIGSQSLEVMLFMVDEPVETLVVRSRKIRSQVRGIAR